jgi:cell cycle checkpoint protein
MDYPDDRQVLESYECIEKVKVSYRLSSINKTLRVLQQSTKTSLRIDTDGLLSLQFVIPPPVKGKKGGDGGGDGGWVEFRCMALDDDV